MLPLLSCVDLGCSPVSWAGVVVLDLNHRFQSECEQPASPACEAGRAVPSSEGPLRLFLLCPCQLCGM